MVHADVRTNVPIASTYAAPLPAQRKCRRALVFVDGGCLTRGRRRTLTAGSSPIDGNRLWAALPGPDGEAGRRVDKLYGALDTDEQGARLAEQGSAAGGSARLLLRMRWASPVLPAGVLRVAIPARSLPEQLVSALRAIEE